MFDEQLHNIDKRLAVMEALQKKHGSDSDVKLDKLCKDVEKVREEMDKLKIRVATVSSVISIIIGVAVKLWS